MGEWEHGDDYEYGFDHLYEEEQPADAVEDADGQVDDEKQDDAELEIDRDDYSDDEPDDSGDIESVLAVERIMREINVRPLDLDISEDTHGMPKPKPCGATRKRRRHRMIS